MKDFYNFFIGDFIEFGRYLYPYLFVISAVLLGLDILSLCLNRFNIFTIIGTVLLTIYFIGIYIAYMHKRLHNLI